MSVLHVRRHMQVYSKSCLHITGYQPLVDAYIDNGMHSLT